MSLDMIEQAAKTIIESVYKKEDNKLISQLTEEIKKNIEELKNANK